MKEKQKEPEFRQTRESQTKKTETPPHEFIQVAQRKPSSKTD